MIMGILEAILDDGIEGACIILLLVVSYKIYRLKININKPGMFISCPGGSIHSGNMQDEFERMEPGHSQGRRRRHAPRTSPDEDGDDEERS